MMLTMVEFHRLVDSIADDLYFNIVPVAHADVDSRQWNHAFMMAQKKIENGWKPCSGYFFADAEFV